AAGGRVLAAVSCRRRLGRRVAHGAAGARPRRRPAAAPPRPRRPGPLAPPRPHRPGRLAPPRPRRPGLLAPLRFTPSRTHAWAGIGPPRGKRSRHATRHPPRAARHPSPATRGTPPATRGSADHPPRPHAPTSPSPGGSMSLTVPASTFETPLSFAYWVPNVSGGLVVSTIEQRTDWQLPYNSRLAQIAEDSGFEYALTQTRYAASYGADRHHEASAFSLALLGATER